jgi:methyl-accepting chemotaxis protein
MKILHKVLLAPLVAIALMVMMAGVAGWGMQSQRAEMHTLSTVYLEARRKANSARYELAQARAEAFRLLTLASTIDETRMKRERADVQARLTGLSTLLTELDLDETAADDPLLKISVDLLVAYGKKADDAIDMGSVDANTGVVSMMSADQTYGEASNALDAAARFIGEYAQQRIDAIESHAQRSFVVMIIATLLAIAVSMAVGVRVARRTRQDVVEAAAAAQALGQGDLTVRFDARSGDEVGDLMRALATMRDAIGRVIRDVRSGVDSVSTASAEIAQGNADLSSRTEQQASNLQQTAASMEQMTSNVRQNSDAARQASQVAAGASEVAEKGGAVVSQVVSTMDEITASSKKITDIISVIDGIAFQTNILALNAAVEAARAGDQGRGFAVVAGEVRSLAQRCAQAAREIKTLIGDSVGKVEAGCRLVNDAGSTMQDIVSQVKRVTDLIGEITSATMEQSNGIGQVNKAVTQLDQMTQQNAALVEQSAAAAQSLREQAHKLAQAVTVFRLTDGLAPAAPTAAADA